MEDENEQAGVTPTDYGPSEGGEEQETQYSEERGDRDGEEREEYTYTADVESTGGGNAQEASAGQTGGSPLTEAEREMEDVGQNIPNTWEQLATYDDEESFFLNYPTYYKTHIYIPYEKRNRPGQGQSNLLIEIPGLAKPLFNKVRFEHERVPLQDIKYGDTLTLCDIYDISATLYAAVLVAEFYERTNIQWKNKRTTAAWLSVCGVPTDIKNLERKFEGRNQSGIEFALEAFVTAFTRAYNEMYKALKDNTRQHPVYEEVDQSCQVLERLTQLHKGLFEGKEQKPTWKQWAHTKNHTLIKGPLTTIPNNNRADKSSMREKAHFLSSATGLAQFVTHLARQVKEEETRQKEEKEQKEKIAVAMAVARVAPQPTAPPTTSNPAPKKAGGGPTGGGPQGGGTVINLTDSQKKKQALQAALAKIKIGGGGLKLYAITANEADTEKTLMTKFNEMDRCFQQNQCEVEQEYEVLEHLCDRSLLGAGFDRITYEKYRGEEELARKGGHAEMSCTLAIAALIRYFKASGYQHLCTGTLIGFEIFDLVSEQLQSVTQLASVLTNVGTQYTLFYNHKAILLYFLSALHVYNKNKLTLLMQDCKTFDKVKHLNFLEMSVFEATTKAVSPKMLWTEVMTACQRLDSQTASLIGSASASAQPQAAHTQRSLGKRPRENSREANTPCIRWWARAQCFKHTNKKCPYNHDVEDTRIRNTLLKNVRSDETNTVAVLRRLRKDQGWKLQDVADHDHELADAINSLFARDDQKTAAIEAASRGRGGTRGRGGGRGINRGGGAPFARGTYTRGGERGFVRRGGGRGVFQGRGGGRWVGRGGYGSAERPYHRDGGWADGSSSSSSSSAPQAYATSGATTTDTDADSGPNQGYQ